MCGIAAIVDPAGGARLSDLRAMTDAIRHRGPDSEGYAIVTPQGVLRLAGPDTNNEGATAQAPFLPTQRVESADSACGWAAVSQRRLAIIDLSAMGHQPMCDPSGRYWIVFNGEIYNYIELRRVLEQRGHTFFGHSDTEVLIAAFAEWDRGFLDRLIGMFAFVLVDTTVRRVFIARDRFGIKPVYAWRMPGGAWAVASEIKQFTTLPGWQARLDGRRGYDFLNFGMTDHTGSSMFADVVHIRGGEVVDASIDDLSVDLPVDRWWRLDPDVFTGSFQDAADQFRSRFEDSISIHLRSDVPLGSCLSGGLDSSSIVCEVRRQLDAQGVNAPQVAFSATSDDPAVDESRWMRIVSEETGVPFITRTPDLGRIPDLLPMIAWHLDEPFGSTSILAQWSVFQLAAEHSIKVMLDGQGADEQLAGYLPFFAWRYQELLRAGRLTSLIRDVRDTNRQHPGASRRLAMLTAYLTVPAWLGRLGGRVIGAPGQNPQEWLDLDLLGVEGHPDPMRELGAARPTVQALAISQLTATNLPALLRYEDRDSMAHSVEARVPFLDHRLVEFVLGLPSEYLISQGTTKRVLREAMRGTLPEQIRTRVDKIGFQTAEESWMRANPELTIAMTEQAIELSGGVLKPTCALYVRDLLAGRRSFDYAYWRRLSFGAWMRAFEVRSVS